MLRERCVNANHARSLVTVRHCPNCGGVVNASIAVRGCGEQKHAAMRRARSVFCVDCGDRLVQDRAGR